MRDSAIQNLKNITLSRGRSVIHKKLFFLQDIHKTISVSFYAFVLLYFAFCTNLILLASQQLRTEWIILQRRLSKLYSTLSISKYKNNFMNRPPCVCKSSLLIYFFRFHTRSEKLKEFIHFGQK